MKKRRKEERDAGKLAAASLSMYSSSGARLARLPFISHLCLCTFFLFLYFRLFIVETRALCRTHLLPFLLLLLPLLRVMPPVPTLPFI